MLNINPMDILLSLPGIVIGLAFHEFAHAYTANKLGDSTPKDQGRLTIDPLPHLDLIGLILIIISGFGWAKPVEVNTHNFRNPRRDDIIVSLSGPMTNIGIVFAVAIILKLTALAKLFQLFPLVVAEGVWNIGVHTIRINLMLFVFNLIPLYPLDGYNIFFHIVPYPSRAKFNRFQRYSTFILIFIAATPIASYILSPIINGLYEGIFMLLQLK